MNPSLPGYALDDTIAAIATAPGYGGIGIVRLSGPEALSIAAGLFRGDREGVPAIPHSHRVYHGHVYEHSTDRVIDEALLTCMRAPHSYTREDVVELSLHGGPVPLRETLALCLAQGARQAGPGEFTLRAFLNGRLDLAQAEAVLDIIESRTARALQVAEGQLAGGLSREIRELRGRLLGLLAHLEATIDFPEDVEPPELAPEIAQVAARLRWLIAEADRGVAYRQGLRTAIVGRPNVGKSSLLNALLRTDRAIVTPIPGTTRDTLEEVLNLQGIPLVLVDTAGIAESGDAIERLGIERTQRALAQADLVLAVFDGSVAPGEDDHAIAAMVDDRPALVALNKSDLGNSGGYASLLPGARHLAISAHTGEGLNELEQALAVLALSGECLADEPVASNPRHRALLQRALEHVTDLQQALARGDALDLQSIDLSEAIAALGEITGEQASDDLLCTIFSRFCIGK